MTALAALLAAALAGVLYLFAGARARLRERESEILRQRHERERDLEELAGERREREQEAKARAAAEAELALERRNAAEKAEEERRLGDRFQSLSREALQANNQQFLQLAREQLGSIQQAANGDLEKRQLAIAEMVKPVKDSLEKVDGKIQELEKARSQAYGALTQQVRNLLETQNALRAETGNLVKALRAPSVRGRWGEIQLRRVVEMAGRLPADVPSA